MRVTLLSVVVLATLGLCSAFSVSVNHEGRVRMRRQSDNGESGDSSSGPDGDGSDPSAAGGSAGSDTGSDTSEADGSDSGPVASESGESDSGSDSSGSNSSPGASESGGSNGDGSDPSAVGGSAGTDTDSDTAGDEIQVEGGDRIGIWNPADRAAIPYDTYQELGNGGLKMSDKITDKSSFIADNEYEFKEDSPLKIISFRAIVGPVD